jgi:hypothetical protein
MIIGGFACCYVTPDLFRGLYYIIVFWGKKGKTRTVAGLTLTING